MIIKYHPDKIYKKNDLKNQIRRGVQQEARRYYLPVKGKYPVLEFILSIPLVGQILRLASYQVRIINKVLKLNSLTSQKLLSKEN